MSEDNTSPAPSRKGGSAAGKAVALFIAAAWILSLIVYMAIEPRMRMSRRLFDAARAGDISRVDSLLRRGAVVNMRDRDSHTALWLAAAGGHAAAVRDLLAHGADPNARGVDGLTPLMAAARNGDADTVQALLDHGASWEARGPNGETALSIAHTAHHEDAAKLLQLLEAD